MFDEFILRALLAGIGVAMIAGPLGCFVVWRRLAYFGDTIAHASLLGIALALLMSINLLLSVFAVTATIAILLLLMQRKRSLSSDALLGILSHSTLAIGLVIVSFMYWIRIDMMAFLFGDILSVSWADVGLIWAASLIALALLGIIWRALLADTVNHDLAEAEGLKPNKAQLIFMLLMATTIAIAMKIVGIMLITSLLIIPAAAARRFAKTPEMMAILAALMGAGAVALGLFGSLQLNTPTGASIVVAALLLFMMGFFQRRK